MQTYGNRLSAAMSFSQHQPLHAERFLLHVAKELDLDITGRTSLLFERVRATGELWGIPSGESTSGDDNVFVKQPGLQVQRDQLGKIQFVPL